MNYKVKQIYNNNHYFNYLHILKVKVVVLIYLILKSKAKNKTNLFKFKLMIMNIINKKRERVLNNIINNNNYKKL